MSDSYLRPDKGTDVMLPTASRPRSSEGVAPDDIATI